MIIFSFVWLLHNKDLWAVCLLLQVFKLLVTSIIEYAFLQCNFLCLIHFVDFSMLMHMFLFKLCNTTMPQYISPFFYWLMLKAFFFLVWAINYNKNTFLKFFFKVNSRNNKYGKQTREVSFFEGRFGHDCHRKSHLGMVQHRGSG